MREQAVSRKREVEENIVADVNQAGAMVGEWRYADGQRSAILVRGDKTVEIGTLGGSDSFATAINDAGTVIGAAYDKFGNWRAFRYDEQRGMRDLGTLGGRSSQAVALNRHGHIAGYADVDDYHWHAFVYDGEAMKDLGTFGGANSYATAINGKGDVVGAAQNAEGYRRAFIYKPGIGLRELPTLGGRINAATAINDRGVVVGASETADRKWHAFLWDGDRMTDIGRLIGRGNSFATGVGLDGKVIGEIRVSGQAPRSFVYVHGAVTALPHLGEMRLKAKFTEDGQLIGGTFTGRKFQTAELRTDAPTHEEWKPVDWLTFFTILPIVLWALWHIGRDFLAWLRVRRSKARGGETGTPAA